MPRKRVYPPREPRLTQAKAANIIRRHYQYTQNHQELCRILIEIAAQRPPDAPPVNPEQPHQQLTDDDATAVASEYLSHCQLEWDPRQQRHKPRQPQPHRPTESRLHSYVRNYHSDLEPRSTDTAPIRLATDQPR